MEIRRYGWGLRANHMPQVAPTLLCLCLQCHAQQQAPTFLAASRGPSMLGLGVVVPPRRALTCAGESPGNVGAAGSGAPPACLGAPCCGAPGAAPAPVAVAAGGGGPAPGGGAWGNSADRVSPGANRSTFWQKASQVARSGWLERSAEYLAGRVGASWCGTPLSVP